jgi:hypothetical protein
VNLKWWQAVLLGLGWLLFFGALLQGRKTAGDLLRGNEQIAAVNERLEALDEAKTENLTELLRRIDEARADHGRELAEAEAERQKAERQGQTLALALDAHLEGDSVGQEMLRHLRASHADEIAAERRKTNAEKLRADTTEVALARALDLLDVRAAVIDTLRIDRDYWKSSALGLATEWSLVGWLPRGWRTAGRIVVCAAGGGLIAWGASATADDVPSSAVAVAGLGSAGLCSVGAFGL